MIKWDLFHKAGMTQHSHHDQFKRERAFELPAGLFCMPIPVNVLRKATEDCSGAWGPGATWETQMKCSVPGFGLTQHWSLWPLAE